MFTKEWTFGPGYEECGLDGEETSARGDVKLGSNGSSRSLTWNTMLWPLFSRTPLTYIWYSSKDKNKNKMK